MLHTEHFEQKKKDLQRDELCANIYFVLCLYNYTLIACLMLGGLSKISLCFLGLLFYYTFNLKLLLNLWYILNQVFYLCFTYSPE